MQISTRVGVVQAMIVSSSAYDSGNPLSPVVLERGDRNISAGAAEAKILAHLDAWPPITNC
jgi:hypothetical protein